jgi:DNA-directed RNA polymerase specialized sigma24 family protein
MSSIGNAGSITRWLTEVSARRETDRSELLWRRFGIRLVRLARHHLRGIQDRAYDEEDLALSTMNEFYRRASLGSYDKLENRDDLWRLLMKISLNKSRNRLRALRRIKRAAKTPSQEIYPVKNAKEIDWTNTPEWLAIVAEQSEYLLRVLDDHDPSGMLQQITLMKLDGASNSQIANDLGCTRRAVAARLIWIQGIWNYYLNQQRE